MGPAKCFRLTAQGRACVILADQGAAAFHWLTRRGHDVLVLCQDTPSLQQLRQCVPPRSLEESLQSLLALGLIEQRDAHAEDAVAAGQPGRSLAGSRGIVGQK